MILRTNPASPYGRKVKIIALYCGLSGDIKLEKADIGDPNDSLREQNPLGKIPVLVLDDGTSLYDSRVICEYLDSLPHDKPKLFPDPPKRWPALTLNALADGIMDAAILKLYERRMRPENKRHTDWVSYQNDKINRSIKHLEANPPRVDEQLHIGHISLACALGYLDFRFERAWRKGNRRLCKWLESFEARVPAFMNTIPSI